MAVNVTEKDKTLNEIIDWCEQLAAESLRLASALLMHHDMDAYGVVRGQVNAYEKTAGHCRSMLGYTGTCPRKYRIKARTRNEQGNPICRVHPLRRDGGHILRDLLVLRIQAGREIDTSEYPFIQLEADELVRMICDAYQTGVFSGKEQS